MNTYKPTSMTSSSFYFENNAESKAHEQSRSLFIDILKGLIMILVIWGHCIQHIQVQNCIKISSFLELPIISFIYSFHMPLFTMVSGYLFGISQKKYSFSECIHHRICVLFWPIITAHIMFLTFSMFVHLVPPLLRGCIDVAFNRFWQLLYSFRINEFWFLWNIIARSVCACVFFKSSNKLIIRLIVLLLCFFFITQFPCGRSAFNMFPFFIAGAIIGNNKKMQESLINVSLWICALVFVLFFLIVPYYKGNVHFVNELYRFDISLEQNLSIWLVCIICGFSGSLSAIILLRIILTISSNMNLQALTFVTSLLTTQHLVLIFCGRRGP